MRIHKVLNADDAETARGLMREYMLSWGIEEVTDPDLLDELQHVLAFYGPPDGCALFADDGSGPLGVVAFKRVDAETCEMKRMYVRPAARRTGVGRELAVELMREAAAAGYKRMRLDTPSRNEPALAMYKALGFVEIPRYFEVPPEHPIQEWTCLSAELVSDR